MTRIKTAIVVETDAQSAMALLFSQIAENLPFEIEVFTDFQAAEAKRHGIDTLAALSYVSFTQKGI